jgi:hypothetical protein
MTFSWNNHVKNVKILYRVKKEIKILLIMKSVRPKIDWPQLAQEVSFKTRYVRKVRSEEKTKKKR